MAEKPKTDDASESLDSNLETEESPIRPSNTTVKVSFGDRIRNRLSTLNIYFLLFLVVVLISAIFVFLVWRASQQDQATEDALQLDNLSQEALDELRNKDASIGDAKQTLTVASNSIFNGRVLIRDSLDVAGTINVGGALSLPGITVSGTSSFDEVEVANNLTIAGDTSIQGNLNVQQTLSVNGGASFAGAISAPGLNIETLTLSNDLGLNRHIDTGGGIPSAVAGASIGGGGTVNTNGSDTAGTVNINTGSFPSAGTLATVNFVNPFNQTPKVVISPVGSGASSLNYYVTKSTSGFSISTTSAPPANANLSFDYIAIE